VSFISDKEGSYLEVVSTDYLPIAEIEFAKERNKEQRSNEQINFEEFISIKGLKAQGNSLSSYKVKAINLLSSLEPPVIEEPPTDSVEDDDDESQIILDF
jgi:topoisomerase-4 subunit A